MEDTNDHPIAVIHRRSMVRDGKYLREVIKVRCPECGGVATVGKDGMVYAHFHKSRTCVMSNRRVSVMENVSKSSMPTSSAVESKSE